MDPMRIHGQTRVVGLDQRYRPLPIVDIVTEGVPYMLTVWHPTEDEMRRLNEGCHVQLSVMGTVHPPVKIDVTDIP